MLAYLWFLRGTWRQTVTEEDRAKGKTAGESEGFGETITEVIDQLPLLGKLKN